MKKIDKKNGIYIDVVSSNEGIQIVRVQDGLVYQLHGYSDDSFRMVQTNIMPKGELIPVEEVKLEIPKRNGPHKFTEQSLMQYVKKAFPKSKVIIEEFDEEDANCIPSIVIIRKWKDESFFKRITQTLDKLHSLPEFKRMIFRVEPVTPEEWANRKY